MNAFIKRMSVHNNLLRNSFALSLAVHGLLCLVFVADSFSGDVYSSEDINVSPLEVEIADIPPELFGGDTDPKKIDAPQWIEGSGRKDEKPDAPAVEENENALSGNSTDGDGYLFSIHGDSPPVPVIRFNVNNYYPAEARRANIKKKTVMVNIRVDERGTLDSVRVASEPAGYGFDEAAVRILKLARFRPGYKNGRRVKMNHTIAFTFQLE
ncbi:MAG: energy transducer TonB [Spirochaetae bacterium HGW-Spirochaetae-1]|jgi:protein TonB|nr:MAG: energy transducer TonB [Spirochaetae bacterium HGW-Spirochaetae-1]